MIDLLINNTGCDIRGEVEEAVRAAANNGAELPEELADLFTLTVIEVNGETRARLDPA